MSAMKKAFEEAGYVDIDERLARIAVDAWAKWPVLSASAARRDYVASQLEGSLAWALWQRDGSQQIVMAIGKLLNDTRPVIEAQQPRNRSGSKPADDGGQMRTDIQIPIAPVVTPLSNAGVSRRSTEARSGSTPSTVTPPAPTMRPGTVDAKWRVHNRLSALDSVVINALPIRRCTVREARAWARVHHTRARFVDLVTANMAENWVVGDYVTDDIADEMFRRAEAEHGE